ncbi:MAG TPA: hypothetical protein PLE54_09950 [Burkholderiaceae bacterium]|nr:hypothetical protein [Burkholderiaceae bacterium]HQR70913.1 hypothetical protein [Burkholderiaceae bacterium]
MTELGAFAFGVVIGWFTYFTNRYRKGDVQFSDLTTLIGVIGGGAVTALFGDARAELFGAYGVGLAVGFFAYFACLLWLVRQSNGVFTWTWFLDGRRKALQDDETIDGSRGPGTAMDLQPQAAAAPAETSLLAETAALRDQSVQDTFGALRDLARRIASSGDDAERAQLLRSQAELTTRQNELLALRLREVLESDAVQAAVAQLRDAAAELNAAAAEMKSAADAFATATKVIDRVTKVLGILTTSFA